MHQLNVTHRFLKKPISLSRTIAEDLERELLYGKVVVVAKNPAPMLSSVKKQWAHLGRKIAVEQARTLDAARRQELSWPAWVLQHTTFTATPPDDQLEADITFATAEHLLRFAPECRMMIVTYNFEKEKAYRITAWMPPRGLVIFYEKG
jgi:hypothetical protein